jgi:hypothetical protein
MPQNRIEKEREYQTEDSVVERLEEQRAELNQLRQEETDLEFEITSLEEEIERVESNIEDVENRLEENDFNEEIEQREQLEHEIRSLRREAAGVSVDIETIRNRLDGLNKEIKAQNHLLAIGKEYETRVSDWKRLRDLIEIVRQDQRRALQRRLEARMDEVLGYFSEGIFGHPNTNATFPNPENYRFSVHTPDRTYQSSKPEEESSEATLHALLFHTAVLKQISEEMVNGIPIRFLVIDSPYTGDHSPENQYDVTQLLTALPAYLEEYQIILTMAKPSDDRLSRFHEQGYSSFEFS